MAKSQNKTCLAIIRSILGPVAGGEARFAKTIGRSRSWLKKASAGIIPLSEDAAARISHETGVSYQWLIANDPTNVPVCINEDISVLETDEENPFAHPLQAVWQSQRRPSTLETRPFTREEYNQRRASLVVGLKQVGTRQTIAMDLHDIIACAIQAEKLNKLLLFSFKLKEFINSMEYQFGFQNIDNEGLNRLASEVMAFTAFKTFKYKNSKEAVEKLKPHKKQPSRKPKRASRR